MQTLGFLWYELEAAKRHVGEAVTESQQSAQSEFNGQDSGAVERNRKRRRRKLNLSESTAMYESRETTSHGVLSDTLCCRQNRTG